MRTSSQEKTLKVIPSAYCIKMNAGYYIFSNNVLTVYFVGPCKTEASAWKKTWQEIKSSLINKLSK